MALKILIVGAGVCGPALAFILQKTNPKHTVTVIERFSSLRDGGQQLDLKAQGIPIMKKMGLLERTKTYCVTEGGMEVVDTNGKVLIQGGVTSAGGKEVSLINEYEFMRGDMVKMFHDASLEERAKASGNGEKEGSLHYEFGKTVTAIDQTDERATVTFSDGKTDQYDLVVAADGQASRTRRLVFGEQISTDAFRTIGVHAAYYNIPRLATENTRARIYFGPGHRMVVTRTGDRPITQVYLFSMTDAARFEALKKTYKEPIIKQKEAWAGFYKDAGWECGRFVDGLMTADDFYATEIAQVKMPNLYRGRTVLLGDAGYCPSSFTGKGTTLSLIGAYILAGELTRHGNDVGTALKAYEEKMQPPIDECQKLPPGAAGGFMPASAWGLRITNNLLWTMSCFKIDKLLQWVYEMLPAEKEGWPVPEYPEMKLEKE